MKSDKISKATKTKSPLAQHQNPEQDHPSILHPKHREYNYNNIANKKHEQSEYK